TSCASIMCLGVTSYYYFRSKSHWDSKLKCSHCNQKGTLGLSTLGQPTLSVVVWICGGFIGSLLYSHARKHHFTCNSCDGTSDLRTAGGWLAAAWLLLLILAIGIEIYRGYA